MRFSTRKMVQISFLTALSIILTRLFSLRIAIGGVEGIRIGFGGLPIIFAGIALGPVAGGLVGAISDVLGYLINPMGAYMPHFTLTSFLTGFIPGLFIYYVFNNSDKYWGLLVSIAIGQLITSALMVPLFLQMLFAIPLKVTLIPRLIGQLIHVPVYAYFIKLLLSYRLVGNPGEITSIKY